MRSSCIVVVATHEAQGAFAKIGFRLLDPAVAQEFSNSFSQSAICLQLRHSVAGVRSTRSFKDGGVFDQIQDALHVIHP
jgi:ABC-type sulfate transport system substrate-binding protein